jgi:hypothetical protein
LKRSEEGAAGAAGAKSVTVVAVVVVLFSATTARVFFIGLRGWISLMGTTELAGAIYTVPHVPVFFAPFMGT